MRERGRVRGEEVSLLVRAPHVPYCHARPPRTRRPETPGERSSGRSNRGRRRAGRGSTTRAEKALSAIELWARRTRCTSILEGRCAVRRSRSCCAEPARAREDEAPVMTAGRPRRCQPASSCVLARIAQPPAAAVQLHAARQLMCASGERDRDGEARAEASSGTPSSRECNLDERCELEHSHADALCARRNSERRTLSSRSLTFSAAASRSDG